MSSQALVGLAVLLGVRYETLVLEQLFEQPNRFTGAWFSSCLHVNESNHAQLLAHLAAHLDAGGSVFVDGPLGAFYRDSDGTEHSRGMDGLANVLGIDWGGWRSVAGYDVLTTTSLHPVAERAGYGLDVALAVDIKAGTDTLVPVDPTAEVLLEVVSPLDGTRYPYLVVAEPRASTKVAMVGGYGNFVGIASPFRNSPSPAFSDNQVLPYLLETLAWATAPHQAPYAGLQVSHAPVTMLGRLDGDWSDVPDATANTLTYLTDLAIETGIATVYGIVSGFAEDADTWSLFAELGPLLQEVGGSLGSHSTTHPMTMSDELNSTSWEAEVAGSLADMRAALATGGFAPDAYAFINPGSTIRAEHYGEFFDDVELYMSHGFELYTPYSTGVQGFGLPSGVPARAVINDVVAPDYQWLYSSSWDYTVEQAAALQTQILDYYQATVGRGVIYNVMWHDYSIGGNSPPEHYPDSPSVLRLFETSREHFWQSEVYAPTVAEVVSKLYVSQGAVITSSYSDILQVDIDYSAVPTEYHAHIAGMGLRIHQQDAPIRRVVIDGVEHFAFSDHTIMMPSPAEPTQRVIVEFGAPAQPFYRLRYASKAVLSAARSGDGVAADLAQPGSAMKYCFTGPTRSVVLGADVFVRTASGEACGNMIYGSTRSRLKIQPLDTGPVDVFIRRATRALANATAIEGGIRIAYFGGAQAVIEFASTQQPTRVVINDASAPWTTTAEGFSVTLPSGAGWGTLEVLFGSQTAM